MRWKPKCLPSPHIPCPTPQCLPLDVASFAESAGWCSYMRDNQLPLRFDRHELATRKFMLDHGQLGPSMHDFIRTPKTASTALDGSDAFSDYVIEEDSSGDEHPKPDEPDSEDDFDSASVFSWTTVGSAIPPLSVSSSYSDLSDLVARLSSPDGLAVTPMSGDPSQTGVVSRNTGLAKAKSADFLAAVSPSILINARCSGYFVQPVSAAPTIYDGDD